ncbi:MAG: VanW family protein [bacterium]
MSDKKWKNLPKHWTLLAIIVLSVLIIFLLGGFILQKLYSDRIYPGVQVGELDLTGKTLEDAQKYIQKQTSQLKDGIVFYYKDKELAVSPTIASFDIDLSYQIFTVNAHKTAEQAFAVGRGFNFFINLKDKFLSLIFKKKIDLIAEINQEKLKELLKTNFDEFAVLVQEAQIVRDDHGNFFVRPEQDGLAIDYDQALDDFADRLSKIELEPIGLVSKKIKPTVLKQNALNIDHQAKQILSLAPLTLNYEDKSWVIEESQISEWLSLELNPEAHKKEVIASLNQELIEQYLKEKIALELDQPAIEAKFKMSGNRVSVFQQGQDGWEMNIKKSSERIIAAVRNNETKISLIVEETKAISDLEEPKKIGIVEIVGTGKSNFAGSPPNRRHNIRVGAETLNGLLIKSGQEFSLLQALGEINANTGYLTELVIKDNKTIPEYGGGLCQIGTTMFRVALGAGMPITMRRSHSYRVSYYEPAGTDATIYSPWPDFKFINDMDHYLLLQTRIEGNDLIFDLWGTKDNRIIEQTKPSIYNITKPEPTKIIETLDLPAGEKKCTERAHNGADTYFDYTVTYSDGEVKEERYYSHYVAWQEVCLLGVEQLSDQTTGIGVYEKMREQLLNQEN